MKGFWCLALLAISWRTVSGHGRLIDPPSRASAWNHGFDTPKNNNDHELYCGGFTRQWQTNGGKCGVCGDPWDAPVPRVHEFGGMNYKGVIVRKYAPEDTIVIKVEITAKHEGYFEFRICDDHKSNDQNCFDKYVLKQEGKDETKFGPISNSRVYEMKYKLPKGLKCEHCVMQWRYIAGNNWGQCENGTGARGCGPQEEFRACADIAISAHAPNSPKIPANKPAKAIPDWTFKPKGKPTTKLPPLIPAHDGRNIPWTRPANKPAKAIPDRSSKPKVISSSIHPASSGKGRYSPPANRLF